MDTYALGMATTKKPTELGMNILRAMLLVGIDQQTVYRELGISYNTWRKRLETDNFTFQDLVKIGRVTGLGVKAILTEDLLADQAA